jgi:assimilatory nitrate reductase catalytic subunit
LFEDGRFFTSDGRARFRFDPPRPVMEPIDREYPFVLLTGRGSSAQWHTGSRTDKSDVLRALAPTECYFEINPVDAKRLNITSENRATLISRRGQITAKPMITPIVQPGQIFVPMHYPELNQLTPPSFDPHSRQPSYKYTAINIVRSEPKGSAQKTRKSEERWR